jgi:hypothetical protein
MTCAILLPSPSGSAQQPGLPRHSLLVFSRAKAGRAIAPVAHRDNPECTQRRLAVLAPANVHETVNFFSVSTASPRVGHPNAAAALGAPARGY